MGPWVKLAVFADRIVTSGPNLTAVEGYLSGRTVPRQPDGGLSARAEFGLVLESDGAFGRLPIDLVIRWPDGREMRRVQHEMDFAGVGTVGWTYPFDWDVDAEGLYYFEVRVGDRILTRVPFELRAAEEP